MGLFMSKHRKCMGKWLLTLAQFEVTGVSISAIMLQFLGLFPTLPHVIITGATTSQVWCACSKLEQKGKWGNTTSSSFPMRVLPTSHFYKDCIGHRGTMIQAVSFPACVGKETEQAGPKLTQPVTTTPQCLQPGVKYRPTLPGLVVALWVFSLQHDGMSRPCYPSTQPQGKGNVPSTWRQYRQVICVAQPPACRSAIHLL